jgi:ferrous iron transport protein A
MGEGLLPLAFLSVGKDAVIKQIVGGRGIRYKLNEMGFTQGAVVRAVQNDSTGPMVVSLRESRMAIGRGMAQKILVEI